MNSELQPQRGYSIGLTYALTFAVYGALVPFIPIILHAHGLSDAETSMALSATGLAALIAPLLFAHLADRRFAFRQLMPCLLLGAASALGSLIILTSFISAFITVFAIFFFLIPALSLLDSFTMDFIIRTTSNAQKRKFQDYRIWGSLGFMIPTAGLLLWSPTAHISPQRLVFIAIGLSILAAMCSVSLPANSPSPRSANLPSRAALQSAFKPPLRKLFLANGLAGLALAIFFIMYPRFLQEIGCSTLEVGLILNFGVLCEVLMMPLASTLIRKCGLQTLILFGMATIPLRLFITILLPTIPVAIATQLLHGPLVIGLFVALPIFLQERADPTFRYSIQSLNATLSQGLTRIFGPWLGAIVVGTTPHSELSGLLRSLLWAGILGLLATILLALPRQKDDVE